jgi:hypothetical protein
LAVKVLVVPKEEAPPEGYDAFNLPQAPSPASEAAGADSLGRGRKPAMGLSGFVQESSDLFVRSKGGAGAKGDPREAEFLKRRGAALSSYVDKNIAPITQRWYKNSEVVRRVDADFGGLDRFMALKARWRKGEISVYELSRQACALPEFRQTVLKNAANPEVWKVTLQMCMEAMKNPPPKDIQDEMVRFITQDKQVSNFVADMSMELLPRLGSLVAQSVPPGMDIGPLQNLAGLLAPPDVRAALQRTYPRR